ncbi:MAG: glycosyltransferase family 39 protein [Chloroflexi bacterium]|nr:glycosyltransferase family 39 protein [Chloroflexota bacterium]
MKTRRREILIVIGCLALLLLLALPILTYPLARDHGVFGTIAVGILEGQPPFIGYWDFKPPAIYYLYALFIALFGQSAAALRLIDLALFPLLGVSLYYVARRLAGTSTAILSLLALGAFYFSESFWSLTQNDGLALAPMLLAAACAFKAAPAGETPRQNLLWAFFAGVCAALTLWFKYTFALFVLALVIGHSISVWTHGFTRGAKMRWLLRDALVFAAGGLLIGLGGLVYMAALGVLDDMILSAQLVAPYAGLGYDGVQWYETPVWRAGVQERLDLWWPLLLLAALWLLLTSVRRARQAENRHTTDWSVHSGWWVIWLWALAMLANVLMQAKGISYQWLPILPPLVLLAADAVVKLSGYRARFLPALAGAALCLLLLRAVWLPALPYLSGQETQMAYYARFRGGEFLASESLQVVNYLQAHMARGDTLYIWGFRPEIYYLGGFRPATRFISQFPLVVSWYPRAWQQENVDALWAAPPPYVLVLQVDNMPWVTGRTEDSNQLLQEYTELNNWLMFNYERETQIGSFFVWRRKTQ